MVKQSFHFEHKDGRIFGCSFRKARNGQYFGWVTIYPTKKDYEEISLTSTWQDFRNIPLQKENVIEAELELKEYCLKNF